MHEITSDKKEVTGKANHRTGPAISVAAVVAFIVAISANDQCPRFLSLIILVLSFLSLATQNTFKGSLLITTVIRRLFIKGLDLLNIVISYPM